MTKPAAIRPENSENIKPQNLNSKNPRLETGNFENLKAKKPIDVCVITGEASGDAQAAHLLEALQHMLGSSSTMNSFWGIGGPCLAKLGFETIVPIQRLSVMGVTDVLDRYQEIREIFQLTLREIEIRRPQAIVLVDFGVFNLRLARELHLRGFTIIYHIPPKVWAHGQARRHVLKKYCHLVTSILPFEAQWLQKFGIPAVFVGNPLRESCLNVSTKTLERENSGDIEQETTYRIGIVPGSRKSEIRALMPILIEAYRLCALHFEKSNLKSKKGIFGIIPLAPTITRTEFFELTGLSESALAELSIELAENSLSSSVNKCRYAIVCSGTAGLEVTFLKIPHCIVYKTTQLTYFLARFFLKIPFISLENLCSNRQIVPEFIQNQCTAQNISEHAILVLENNSVWQKIYMDCEAVTNMFPKNSAVRCAKEILRCICNFNAGSEAKIRRIKNTPAC